MSSDNDSDRTDSFAVIANGTVIDHYRVIGKIGAGGMGDIFLAEDTRLDRRVALKFLSSHLCRSHRCRTRFKREAQSAANLSHPNIVTIHEVGEFRGRPYFTMEYIDGRDLKSHIEKRELDLKRILKLSIQICNGLEKAHKAGIVHRDIKPSNIIIDADGRPRLLDFGLVSVKDGEKITSDRSRLGTADYMSPEQIRGKKIDNRSDIFSFGMVLYEMLTGRHPFAGDNVAATMNAILHETPPAPGKSIPDFREELQHVISKALEKDPDLRYQHIDELKADLIRIKTTMESGPSLSLSGAGERHRRSPVARAALTVLMALVILAFLVPSTRREILSRLHLERTTIARHLAVLPFTNLGETASDQTFCDGLMETLTSHLTRMEKFQGSLWVVPAREIRERQVSSVADARKAFDVNLAVTGSVQQLKDKIRLALNLVDVDSERQLRSALIDVPREEMAALQDSTVMNMARMLEIQLGLEDREFLTAGGTDSPEAYDLYLAGRGFLWRFDEKDAYIDTAIQKFRLAIEFDSSYALAMAGLGEAYLRKYQVTYEPEWIDQARARSLTALSFDDRLAPVHNTLGLIYKETGEYEMAVQEYKRTFQITPTNNEAIRGLAQTYESLNMLEEAEANYRKIIQLQPDRWGGYFDMGYFYNAHGEKDKAVTMLHHAAELVPYNVWDYNDIGVLYYMLDYNSDARKMWQKSLEIEPNYAAYSNLGYMAHMERNFEEAASYYEKALELSDRNHIIINNLASAYDRIPGKKEKAMELFKQAIAKAEIQFKVNPLDPDLLVDLAQYYARVNDSLKAYDFVDKALELTPNNAEICVRALNVYVDLGRRDHALQCLDRVLALNYPIDDLKNHPDLGGFMNDPEIKKIVENFENKSHINISD